MNIKQMKSLVAGTEAHSRSFFLQHVAAGLSLLIVPSVGVLGKALCDCRVVADGGAVARAYGGLPPDAAGRPPAQCAARPQSGSRGELLPAFCWSCHRPQHVLECMPACLVTASDLPAVDV